MKNLAIIVVVIILIVASFAYFGGTKTTEPVGTATSTGEAMMDEKKEGDAMVEPIVDEATPAATGTTPAASGTPAI